MSHTARGTFEVTLTPLTSELAPPMGGFSIDKTFAGDLVGTSVGQMLSAMGGVEGSAGYVAIEVVTGTLGGRKGSFVLQHSATMDRGRPSMSITVLPDSGTDELLGLVGSLEIQIDGGEHRYVFEYSLPQ
ncbi:MAG: DUF3224 domain-containing protein [Gemmatimonadota bacterium]